MTRTDLAPREQMPEVEPGPHLVPVPATEPATEPVADSLTEGDVPGGSSGDVPAEIDDPTRDARVTARARYRLAESVTSREQWSRLGGFLARAGKRVWRCLTTNLTPPDVVTKPQPSLREVFRHACWGSQHPDVGPGRVISVVLSVGLLPFVAVGKVWAWVFERPARVLLVGGLLFVCSKIPGVSTGLEVFVSVFSAPINWL